MDEDVAAIAFRHGYNGGNMEDLLSKLLEPLNEQMGILQQRRTAEVSEERQTLEELRSLLENHKQLFDAYDRLLDKLRGSSPLKPEAYGPVQEGVLAVGVLAYVLAWWATAMIMSRVITLGGSLGTIVLAILSFMVVGGAHGIGYLVSRNMRRLRQWPLRSGKIYGLSAILLLGTFCALAIAWEGGFYILSAVAVLFGVTSGLSAAEAGTHGGRDHLEAIGEQIGRLRDEGLRLDRLIETRTEQMKAFGATISHDLSKIAERKSDLHLRVVKGYFCGCHVRENARD